MGSNLTGSKIYNRKPAILNYWWLFAAFFGPFALALFLTRHVEVGGAAFLAMRSGLTGLMLASCLYILWKIDCRLNKTIKPDRTVDAIISFMGIFLWSVWFSICQIIFIASEEVNNTDYSQTWHS